MYVCCRWSHLSIHILLINLSSEKTEKVYCAETLVKNDSNKNSCWNCSAHVATDQPSRIWKTSLITAIPGVWVVSLSTVDVYRSYSLQFAVITKHLIFSYYNCNNHITSFTTTTTISTSNILKSFISPGTLPADVFHLKKNKSTVNLHNT